MMKARSMTARIGARLAAAALALGALLAAAPAAAKFDPARRWLTAETPHFVLHFPEECGELAARAARLAEEAHARLVPRIGWEPRARTRLIVSDDEDAANGWAAVYPYNQILVSATAPLGEPGLGTTVHDDWLRLVITHEYTHILQIDQASRLPLALRSIFGRLYFPNALQPTWLIEGLATFEETELTAGGRGRSPGTEMLLRMAVLEGVLPTLDEMAVFPDRWPSGQIPYLFGESFIRYLAGRFGRDKVAEIGRAYGGRTLPWFVESTGRRVLGAEYRDLWRDWSEQLRTRFGEQQRAVAARGLTPSTPLTTDGRFNLSPAWSPDGARIAWLRADGRRYPGLWVMNADGSGRRRLVKDAFSTTSSAATLAWSPDGRRLYYTQPGFARGAAVVNDLWACDVGSGRRTRITRGLRARDPHPSPDGRTLALVTGARGLTRLALLDLDGPLPVDTPSRLRFLTPPSSEQFAQPRWSPNGTRIALSVWSPGGGQEIRVVDRDGRTVAAVARDRALDGAPAWSPDGSRIYFSSDRTGIFNIFFWEVASGALTQVTNVLGGAFTPAPSPDSRRLAFADYTARGFDLRVVEISGLPAGSPAAPWVDPYPPPVPPAVDAKPLEVRPYSALATVLPRLWFPLNAYSPESGTLFGIVTGGQDVLQRHAYTLVALYGPESGRFMHTLDYAYDGLRPTLRLFSSDSDRTFSGLLRDPAGRADYTERERSLGAEATLAFPGFDSSQAIGIGYRYRDLSALTPLPPFAGYAGVEPARGSLGSSRLTWSFSSAHRQALSISPGEGRSLRFGLERYQEGFGSSRSFTRVAADWAEYLSLPQPRHVLQTRLFLGGAGGDTPPQGAFGLGGDAPGDISYSLDDRALHLRGYPLNAFRGDRALLAGLEYRFPLFEIGRGGISLPFFLRRVHGALFIDAGEAWNGDRFHTGALKAGVGAEVRLDMYFSYFAPLTLRLGVAAGLDKEGGVYPTLGLWLPQGRSGAARPMSRR